MDIEHTSGRIFKKVKIAFLSRYQNIVNRGAETFVAEVSSRLRKKYSVDVFSGKDADFLPKIINGKYDVVIPMNGGLQSLGVSLGRIFGGYKIIIIGQAGIGKNNIWNVFVAQPDIFVALTDYMAKWIKNWAWNSRVLKIPNGVDLQRFKKEGERVKFDLNHPIILSVGALDWYKHHDRTIEAVTKLEKVNLLIIGEGGDYEKLSKLGKEKLGKRFKISKFDYKDMPNVYRGADLFTLPSWDREAFGIAYVEAMASNLPVVAPDDPPRREIIGKAGVFVDTTDPQKYAKAIENCLNINWDNKPRLQAIKFSWDKIVRDYEEIVGNLR